MTTKTILIFLSGVAAGAAAGILGTKKFFEEKYEKITEKHITDLEDYYGRTDEYLRGSSKKEQDKESTPDGEDRSEGPLSNEKRNEIREKLKRNHQMTTNYAGMYKGSTPNEEEDLPFDNGMSGGDFDGDPLVTEHPMDSDEDEEEDEPIELQETLDHERTRDRKPRIISAEALGELPPRFESETLYFYAYDEILTDENDELIDEPGYLLGDCLEKYGFIDNDEQLIIVQNFALDKVYEVQKIMSSFEG